MTTPAINNDELVTLSRAADGTINVVLQRFGKVRVSSDRSPLFMEVSVERDRKKDFRCFVTTGVEGKASEVKKVAKLNGGKEPSARMMLCVDGRLKLIDGGGKRGNNAGKGDSATGADGAEDAEGKKAGVEEDAGEKEGAESTEGGEGVAAKG